MQVPTNEILANWDPASRLVALAERAHPRYKRDGLAGLNEAERTIVALFDLDNEVCNGGFGQWLFHTPLELIAITPECLERIGETQVLRLVWLILGELGPDALGLDWNAWDGHLHRLPRGFWDRISGFDRECGSLEHGMIERLWAYASKVMTLVRMP